MEDRSGFDAWLPALDDDTIRSDSWMQWLRDLYEQHGPLPLEEVEARGLHDMTAVLEFALSRVLDDVERVRGVRPQIELVSDHGLRIGFLVDDDNLWEEPPEGLSTPDQTEALVEVADAVFDLLADGEMAVPFDCPKHHFGLHPRQESGQAVWWCNPGAHAVAEIGRLGCGAT